MYSRSTARASLPSASCTISRQGAGSSRTMHAVHLSTFTPSQLLARHRARGFVTMWSVNAWEARQERLSTVVFFKTQEPRCSPESRRRPRETRRASTRRPSRCRPRPGRRPPASRTQAPHRHWSEARWRSRAPEPRSPAWPRDTCRHRARSGRAVAYRVRMPRRPPAGPRCIRPSWGRGSATAGLAQSRCTSLAASRRRGSCAVDEGGIGHLGRQAPDRHQSAAAASLRPFSLRHPSSEGASLGARGHPRASEWVFGGAVGYLYRMGSRGPGAF